MDALVPPRPEALTPPRQNARLSVLRLEPRDVPNAACHPLLTSYLTQNWSNPALITADNNWSAVPSIQGFRGDNLTTGIGVDPRTILADGSGTPISVLANRTNTNLTTGGVGEFHLANPVVALQGSVTADVPQLVLYLDATSVSGVMVSFTLRDIDGSANNAAQQVAVQYRVGGGAWANVPGGYVADATAGPGLAGLETPVSVVLPAAADDQSNVQVRILTTNAAGFDEWVGIDDIAVTHDHAINKWTGSGLFSTPTNWSLGRAPIADDVVVFDGAASNAACTYDGTSAASSFAYVRLVNSFSGTLRLESSMEVGTVELATGTIDQPTASPFTIGDLFTWTGGTLNSTSTLASVYFDGGSMANITPGAGNTLSTGSQLVFGPATAPAPTVAAFNPGIIEFRNDAGIEVGAFCVAEIKPGAKASVTFKDATIGDGSKSTVTKVLANGLLTVKGPGIWDGQGAAIVNAGDVTIKDLAAVSLSGNTTLPDQTKVSFHQTGGFLELHTDSSLDMSSAAVIADGRIYITSTPANLDKPATLGADLIMTGGRVVFNTPDQVKPLKFLVDGSMKWSGGTLAFRMDGAADGGSDLLQVNGKLTISGKADITVEPINEPASLPATFRRKVIQANTGIDAKVTPPVETLAPGTHSYKFTREVPGNGPENGLIAPK